MKPIFELCAPIFSWLRHARTAALCGTLLLLGAGTLAAADDAPLTVSIAVPASSATRGERMIRLGAADAHFHVVISNTTGQVRRVWGQDCSWGYGALSLEITDDTGKTWAVKKKARGWRANTPYYLLLDPHESLVLDVNLADLDVWEGVPPIAPRERKTYSMRAVFAVDQDAESQSQAVWTGKIVSKSEKYLIIKNADPRAAGQARQ